jgi:hypothetical protein
MKPDDSLPAIAVYFIKLGLPHAANELLAPKD